MENMTMIIKITNDAMQKIVNAIDNDRIKKIVVGAVITNSRKEVLLLKRVSDDFMGGLVELPSGTVDEGEYILPSLIREVKEETGLDVTSVEKYISSFDYVSSSGKKTRQLSFLVSINSTKIQLNEEEHSEYYWVSVGSELYNSLNISDETKATIESEIC
jgi:8-oxo-dGTP diphosphatase